MRIVLTESDHDSFEPELAALAPDGIDLVVAQARTHDELVAACADADGIGVQYARITAELMDALPRLRAVGRYGVGVDSVDVDAATERGIAVCNVPDYGTEAVSDHAIALALAASRGIAKWDRDIRAGKVDFPGQRPQYLNRKRVFGIIGLGLIGTATARKAAGLGFEVIATDLKYRPGTVHAGVDITTLDDLLQRSQVISVHVPLDPESKYLLNASKFALMRPDAVLVNTARGGVVDTNALVDALRTGQIRAAGIDTLEDEPPSPDHPIASLDNVTLSPHFAWYSEETYDELKRRTVANVADVLMGRQPRNILNPQVLGAPGRNAGFGQ